MIIFSNGERILFKMLKSVDVDGVCFLLLCSVVVMRFCCSFEGLNN